MSLALPCAPAAAQATNVFPESTATGQSSPPLTVMVTMTLGGTAGTPQALTQGVSNGEFTIAPGGNCAGASLIAGQQCTAMVAFNPKYPGPRSGAVVIETSGGSFMGVALLSGLATGPLPVLTEGVINTVAGDANWIYQGDGVLATEAPIFLPTGLAIDAAGNLYLSDSGNNRVRRVDAQTGLISTVAGTGSPGDSGDDGLATQAMVSAPAGLLLDGAGDLYIADTGNHTIRRVDAFSGIITTVAGTPGTQGYSGNGSVATQARLSLPEGVAFDAAGDLLIADTGNNVVREVNAATGTISTIAGTGTAGFNGDGQTATTATLNSPWSVTVAQNGSFYIADFANNRVRLVNSSGMISTVAGTGIQGFSGDNGKATTALIDQPAAVVLDPAGDLYIADSGNNRVREVNASTGMIATITGNTSEQFAGDAGPANLASLYGPYALFFDENGNLFIADMFHNRVREINAQTVSLVYATIKVGNVSLPQAVLVANDGNADMDITAPGLVNAKTDPATTTCTVGADILSATTCNIGADFAPTVTGDPVLGSITINSNATSTAPVIKLSGEVLNITPTMIAVTSSLNPSLVGAAVTFTATVSGGTALTGTIVFFNGMTQLCSVTISNSSATCTTSGLTLGSHNITASYSGDSNDSSSVSPVLVQVVLQSPVLTLTVAPNPAIVTANVTLTLTATAPTGTPTGTVTFYDGAVALSAANISASGVATFSTTQLSVGTHSLSVKYPGDTSNAAGQSNVVNEVIQQATTGTTLSSSNNPALVGSQVTFTAVVTSTNGPEPTGTVQFNDGGTSLGSGVVGSNGTAVLSLTSLTPGTHSIVAVYSDDTDNLASTSAPLIETIQQIPTATALTPSLNPISAGATLNLAAAVTATGAPAGAGAITGNVTFSEGATVYGTVALNASGGATLPISTLSAGSHSIIASYAGNTNYAASTSAILVEVVQSTATTTTLTSTAATTLAGEPASFTASVSSTTGIPTGNVTFYDGATALGQVPLNAQGMAVFSTTTLAVGMHTLTAVYAGNGNYNTSTSTPPLQHMVTLATPSLTLAGPAAPVDAGQTFVMTATLNSNGVAPTGTLTLRNGAATIATQNVAANGTFSFPNLSLAVGTYQLTAVYGGDANNGAVTSSPVTVIVQLTPTTTSLISSANPATLGQSVTFTATASGGTPIPTGLIEFMDGSTVLGSSPVGAGGTATFSTSTLAFGTHAITASYQGDTDHAVSSSVALNEQIVEAATASLISSVNPSIFGTNVIFTVKITGSGSQIPTGTVIFKDGAATLGTVMLDGTGTATLQSASLAVGSHPISASYGGDTNYSAASAMLVQTVQSATTQVTLVSSTNPATYATPATFTATVVGNGGVATGSVTFTDGGASIGSALLNANGVAVLTTSTLAPGTHTIVANYAGDSNIGASSSTPLTFSVKQLTSIALASNANPAMTLSPIVLTATVTNSGIGEPTGTMTFTDGSTQLGTATLNASGMASLTVPSLTVGNHSLSASYAGDSANFTSTSSGLTEVIQLRPTTVAITSSDTNPTNPLQITLISAVGWTGPVTPTGTVTFTNGTTVLGSSQVDSIGVATLTISLQSATESIVATYNGDASYAGSSSLATSVTGGIASQFTLQIAPSTISVSSGQHAVISVSATSLQGFSDTLQLGCLGLPYAATCTFSTPQVNLGANGIVTAQLIIDTGNPLGAGSTAQLDRRQTSGVLLCLLPCLLGIGFGARRKKIKASTLLLMVCMVTMTLSAMGCAGLHVNGTPVGTYTFKVTASGESSGATLSQAVTLTVTQ